MDFDGEDFHQRESKRTSRVKQRRSSRFVAGIHSLHTP